MSAGWALLTSLVLLALNGFFVAAEFALVASKRYRLEQAAAGGSRAARAALDGSRELSLMLAGAQLGITVCTLGLGALAEPAVERLVAPLLERAGLPYAASHLVAFLFALALVVFLHLVVGEMAPKSWAITHPERSALLLALPFRAFARVSRPVLSGLNAIANAVLRAFRVEPQDQLAQVHGPDELRILLEQSREHGLLPPDQHELLAKMLQLERTTVRDVMQPVDQVVAVARTDTAVRVEELSRGSGRSRLVVYGEAGDLIGIVHVRDAVRANTCDGAPTAESLMSRPFLLPATATVTEAVAAMRADQVQLALVTNGAGADRPIGFVALEDLLEEVIGEFDDETDAVPRGRRMR
ncbi:MULTISPECIES: hemolysin family protein [unclassified Solwaraspora]|uniref:hemolysin family protein n=1 Tax=unclassified Solwaraspora TaxID=2627926 RepID=UPI00248C625F|nr:MULTISPECIES: hemolysin family protein [unclassified Solwaraspora]WBB98642.1 hemolysin family protein [Solwaraspora sp. WMMA2059]WBC22806.1 hemolysin family protein [Solwaraspora sp. WMMA2080]WJK35153.1 hemolysin family protein [Solwaraspora sp. WMMA2065]